MMDASAGAPKPLSPVQTYSPECFLDTLQKNIDNGFSGHHVNKNIYTRMFFGHPINKEYIHQNVFWTHCTKTYSPECFFKSLP